MLKKQMIASILAIIFTLYSGGLTFASATTQNLQTKNPTSKADFCSGYFLSSLCGKIDDVCIPADIYHLTDPSVTLLPQEATQGLYAITSSKKEEKRPAFTHTYEVAMASPTSVPTTTTIPSPTVAVQAAVAVNPEISQPTGAGLNSDTIFSMVNDIRAQYGLAPFEKSADLCAIANERAPELYAEIFVNGNMHAGFMRRQAITPYRMNENMIHQNTEQQAVNWWMNSPIHRSALLGNYTNACVSCQGNSCTMIFSSFVAK